MAYRRKYKSGGAVPVEDVVIELPEEEPIATLLEPEPAPDEDAVQRAAVATIRADELQRQALQAQQPQTPDQYIDNLPLSDRRKSFLKKNTLLLDPKNQKAIEFYYGQSQDLGLAPDSDAEDQHILRGVLAEIEAERKRGIEAAHAASNAMRSPPMPEQNLDHAADRLDREVEGHRAVLQANDATPAAIASEIAPPAPAPRSSPRAPMSAPVSRQVPSASGSGERNMRQITLTGEQRAVARLSYNWLTPEQAELEYAFQLRKMMQKKASGEIQ